MTTFDNLRAANHARQIEWDPSNQITALYRAIELAGETGELANVVKKLERERLGLAGSRETKEHLAEELADVFICLDLFRMGLNFPGAFERKDTVLYDYTTGLKPMGFLLARIGKITDLVTIHEEKAATTQRIALTLADEVAMANIYGYQLAGYFGIDPLKATQDKFNATSEKVGLRTRLAYP